MKNNLFKCYRGEDDCGISCQSCIVRAIEDGHPYNQATPSCFTLIKHPENFSCDWCGAAAEEEPMGNSRAYTRSETLDLYLDHIAENCRYWSRLEGKTTLQKLQGLAFSILVMLDGESELPACEVTPISHKEDTLDRIKDGDNWFPQGVDIAGDLHEKWCMRKDQA